MRFAIETFASAVVALKAEIADMQGLMKHAGEDRESVGIQVIPSAQPRVHIIPSTYMP